MRKVAGVILFVTSAIVGFFLIDFAGDTVTYSELIIDETFYETVMNERVEHDGLLERIIFDEQTLFLDETTGTFYYSLVEGSSSAFDPRVEINGKGEKAENVKIAFVKDAITEEGIKNNKAIVVLVYTDDFFCEYYLKCTTLPIISIECSEKLQYGDGIEFLPISMSMMVFDNRSGAVKRVILSDGTVKVRGASSKYFPKTSYRIALTQQSVGDNNRKNDLSLLGMRQDDDWILYAAYNDQEKVRNVFSSNLWTETCGADNSEGIKLGNEYKFVELFMDGEYYGLYALGYPIDEKVFELDGSEKQILYKVYGWINERQIQMTDAGIVGVEVKSSSVKSGELHSFEMLADYYENLCQNENDNEYLYNGIDTDNAINLQLFLNMIQGLDNVRGNSLKNMYICLKESENGIKAIYVPWDMDLTWGNEYKSTYSDNYVSPYALTPEVNINTENGYLGQLYKNDSSQIWKIIVDKYWNLRKTSWSDEALSILIDKYEADIYGSGAYLREVDRWPSGTYGNLEEGLERFENYVRERMRALDEYYK